jgi:DNA-binding LacI/PurR family transcriptional regulator
LVGIRELARHLEISIGTVSRALNDRADVNPLTRQRVRDAAAKLGYSPNQSGRSLRRGQTDLIGVIIPGGGGDPLINMVFLYVLAGLRRRLSQERLDLAIFLEDGGDDRLEGLRRVTERGLVDAVIISDTAPDDPRADYLAKLGKPFVAFGRTRSPLEHAWIDPDFEAAVDGAVEHLVRLGHRRIALSRQDVPTNYVDIIGRSYRRAMRRWGIGADEGWELRRPPGERGGLAAAEALLNADPRPTAVLISDAMHAVALYRRLGEAGMLPGRELSIVGILPEARVQTLMPALTSYETDWAAIGERLGEAVILELARAAERRTAGDVAPTQRAKRPMQLKVPVEFKPGDSVGPVGAARETGMAAGRGPSPRRTTD